jgi:phosphate:Na+ symporter
MTEISWADAGVGLVGGLALFLLGIDTLTRALKLVTGDRLRGMLSRGTENPVVGAVSGAAVTGILQSSSITTVLVVGFVSAGAMTLQQSVGVILGANVGSTLTVQLIAFDVTRFALLIVAIGFAGSTSARLAPLREPSKALLGIGLVFFGMDVMSGAAEPLRTATGVLDFLASPDNLVVGLVVGAIVTALIQSSAAVAGILIVLASQGLLDLQMGIAIALGANIGTCATAAIAAAGRPRVATRAATIHVLFNTVGALVWIWFVPQLAEVAAWLAPAYPDLAGVERIAAETPRQLANAHTLFNVANVLLFIGFTRPLARLTEWLLPDRPQDLHGRARYLDDSVLDTPDAALTLARREVTRLARRVEEMVTVAVDAVVRGTSIELDRLAEQDEYVDALYRDVLDYLRRIGLRTLSDEQSDELLSLIAITNDLEAIGDVVETNLVRLGHRRIEQGLKISGRTARVVTDFHAAVLGLIQGVVVALDHDDPRGPGPVIEGRHELVDLRNAALDHLAKRLQADAPNRVSAYGFEMEVINHLFRIGTLCRHVARALKDDAG